MKKVIITGANGFIGNAVVKYFLKQNIKVYAISRTKLEIEDENFISIQADFSQYLELDKKVKDDIDVFFHFAWQGTSGIELSDYKMQVQSIEYSCDALILAKNIKTKKFIFVNTINESEAKFYLNNSQINPRKSAIYSFSKLTANQICKIISSDMDIEYVNAIISNGYGYNDKSQTVVNMLLRSFLQNTSPKLVKYEMPYDIVYIEDIAKAFYAIGNNGKNGKDYYIGHENIDTFGNLVTKIRDIVNPNINLNFGIYSAQSYVDFNLFNAKMLLEDTGFKASYDFEESIKKTAKWVKYYFLDTKEKK